MRRIIPMFTQPFLKLLTIYKVNRIIDLSSKKSVIINGRVQLNCLAPIFYYATGIHYY